MAEVYPQGPVFHLSPHLLSQPHCPNLLICSMQLKSWKMAELVSMSKPKELKPPTDMKLITALRFFMGTRPIARLQLGYKTVSYLRKDTQKTVLIKMYDPPQINILFLLDYLFNKYYLPPFHQWNTVLDDMRGKKIVNLRLWFLSPRPWIFHLSSMSIRLWRLRVEFGLYLGSVSQS